AQAIEGLAGNEEEIDGLQRDLPARRGLAHAEGAALDGLAGGEGEEEEQGISPLHPGEGAAESAGGEPLEDRGRVELPGEGEVEGDGGAGPGLAQGREGKEPLLGGEGAPRDLLGGETGAQAIDGRAERALLGVVFLHRTGKEETPALAVWEHPSNPAKAGGGG